MGPVSLSCSLLNHLKLSARRPMACAVQSQKALITLTDVVEGLSRAISGSVRTCVCVYVSTLKQKPLDISSPNLAAGHPFHLR